MAAAVPGADGLAGHVVEHPARAGLHAELVDAVAEHVVGVAHDDALPSGAGRQVVDGQSALVGTARWLPSMSSSTRVAKLSSRAVEVVAGADDAVAGDGQEGPAQRVEVGGRGRVGVGGRAHGRSLFVRAQGAAGALRVPGLPDRCRGSRGQLAPDGTKFEQGDAGIAVTFAGKRAFLVVCPLPSEKDFALFHKHAFAVPRDTQLSWTYDRHAATITTTWKVVTEPLKPGASGGVIQGFLPHHWRENIAKLDLDGPSYATIRGPLKCGAGDTFTITYPFHGILPNLPAPTAKSFDSGRVKELLAQHFTDPTRNLGGDTYWGGKDVQRYAQAAFVAAQTKDRSLDAILGKLRGALDNWFTYTPGEKDRFFACLPRRKGLVGFNAAYGSEHFTDTHFHLGYFVHASGLLSQLQPEFAASYGDFARLVAKNYANYDRKDTRFPRFRTFDIWRGHSFADGNGFPDGNNQESTGEAVNSWAGMILLGEALGDAELTAAGVIGYSFETRANVEYWFDPHGDVFPKAYAHNACGHD